MYLHKSPNGVGISLYTCISICCRTIHRRTPCVEVDAGVAVKVVEMNF